MGNQVRVLVDSQKCMINIPGKWRLETRGRPLLVVGDKVYLEKKDNVYMLKKVLPRRNEFTRRVPGRRKIIPQVIAVNLDLAIVIASAAKPESPFGLIDRLLVSAELGGVDTILVVNKIDLISPEKTNNWAYNYLNATNKVLFTSAVTGKGIESLSDVIRDLTVLFAGASGVGKSTLANCIDPSLNIKTREISEATGKGKHTTTSSILHATANGGWLTDTPGLRECAPYGKTPLNLSWAFPEIRRETDNCHFRDCLHRSESNCAVRDIAGTAKLPEDRYQSYLKLLGEAEEEQIPDYKR